MLKKWLIVLIVCLTILTDCQETEKQYYVSRVAGAASSGRVDGDSSIARFDYLTDLVVDHDGNIYVVDQGNNSIRKIARDGRVLTIAGTFRGFKDGPVGEATFNSPSNLALGKDGSIYVSDMDNNRIRKISPDGFVTTVAGNGTPGFQDGPAHQAQFRKPVGIEVDENDNIYVTDYSNHRIRKITHGNVTTIAGDGTNGFADGQALSANFSFPYDITMAGDGNFYIADANSHRIRKLSSDGIVTTIIGKDLYNIGYQDGTADEAKLNWPTSLVMDKNKNIFVVDHFNNVVRKVHPDGSVSTFAGNRMLSGYLDGKAREASFNGVLAIAIDSDNNLFVADIQMIRKIAPR